MDTNVLINDFITKLQRRNIEGSLKVAKMTAILLRQIVSFEKRFMPTLADGLLDSVKTAGARMTTARPAELTIGNVVRRVLHIIREEDAVLAHEQLNAAQTLQAHVEDAQGGDGSEDEDYDDGGSDEGNGFGTGKVEFKAQTPGMSGRRTASLHNLLEANPRPRPGGSDKPSALSKGTIHENAPLEPEAKQPEKPALPKAKQGQLKTRVIEAINELLEEIDSIHIQIAEQAIEHIHANEVILTVGASLTAAEFLKEAAKKRPFHVIVGEGAPRYLGHDMAKTLASAGIQTTLITDAAVFPLMARVNLVLISAHGVMANGGVIAPVGAHTVALAAQCHSVPCVVLAGLHKLSPIYPHNPDIMLNEINCPAQVLASNFLAHALHGAAADASDAHAEQRGGQGQGTDMGRAGQRGEPGQRAGGEGGADGPAKAKGPGAAPASQELSPGGGKGGHGAGEGGGAKDGEGLPACTLGELHVANPAYDYIPPELVSLFITDSYVLVPSLSLTCTCARLLLHFARTCAQLLVLMTRMQYY
eukprot:jgi/Mesvir1/16433/Mv18156-RA.1